MYNKINIDTPSTSPTKSKIPVKTIGIATDKAYTPRDNLDT
ncbi:hypothetical protein Nther_2088 [Natranaerobius thermophilus JW/NM-WN-LF]|uniref:Uncharacterized protein n=1 Tax=Natranaerobius thermophilus (strain ATCC BAA-1301 / DSM 18059 / JW/NM-WN-LF) TaxID=457570 RepID=B2A7E6_NATTJ|nr:hypothetical protein Nther_2088 [Natranaerobius thermophilus JW/NM-WN-LF]